MQKNPDFSSGGKPNEKLAGFQLAGDRHKAVYHGLPTKPKHVEMPKPNYGDFPKIRAILLYFFGKRKYPGIFLDINLDKTEASLSVISYVGESCNVTSHFKRQPISLCGAAGSDENNLVSVQE